MGRAERESTGPNRGGWRRVLLGASEVALFGAGLSTLLGFVGDWSWALDLFSHFRLQYLLILATGGALAAIIRVWWITGASALLALANLMAIGPLYSAPETVPGRARIHIAHLNVLSTNADELAVLDWLEGVEADVVFINELSPAWEAAFETSRDWKLEVSVPRADNFGIGMLVRSDAAAGLFETRVLQRFGVPAIEARTGLGGHEVALLGLHTLPPVGGHNGKLHAQQIDEAIGWVDEQRAEGRVPTIVGDLNTSPYSARYRRLVQGADLVDSQWGRGPQGSFPAGLPTRISIDHVMHDPTLVTVARGVGPSLGSDHLPVMVTLAISESAPAAPADPVRSSEPMGDPIPLEHVGPGQPLDELDALAPILGDARVIAVGEGTHGSHEFFAMRHRLLEWLVERHGVRAVALESSLVEVNLLERHVQGNSNRELRELVLENSTWPWRTREVVETLQWVHDYNEGREAEDRVHVYGVDVQQPWVTLRYLETMFENDPTLLRVVADDLAPLANRKAGYLALDEQTRVGLAESLRELQNAFIEDSDTWREELLHEYEIVHRALVTLRQVVHHYGGDDSSGVSSRREHAMADNVRWVADHLHPEARVVVWAHNGHVSRVPLHGTHPAAMGGALHRHYGEEFFSLGFVFNQGRFVAEDRDAQREKIVFQVPPGPTDGIGPRLAALDLPVFLLDLRTSGELQQWLARPREMWAAGATVSNPTDQVANVTLTEAYDAIIFIEAVEAARSFETDPPK